MKEELELSLKLKYPKTFRYMWVPPYRIRKFSHFVNLLKVLRSQKQYGSTLFSRVKYFVSTIYFAFTPKKLPVSRRCLSMFGIETGDGWYGAIDRLASELEPLITDDSYFAVQVKEKWGGLRFYMSYQTDAMTKLIDRAESEAYETCERCGKPGKPNGDGWISTLCDNCRRKP